MRFAASQVYRVTPLWEDNNKHFTKDFEAFALTLMREMSVKKMGEIVQVDDGRLWRMLLTHIDDGLRLIAIAALDPFSDNALLRNILIFVMCDNYLWAHSRHFVAAIGNRSISL